MNNFSASITIDKLDGEAFDCDIRNFLLRGCTLRNIEYVQGIVVYIGKEAKKDGGPDGNNPTTFFAGEPPKPRGKKTTASCGNKLQCWERVTIKRHWKISE